MPQMGRFTGHACNSAPRLGMYMPFRTRVGPTPSSSWSAPFLFRFQCLPAVAGINDHQHESAINSSNAWLNLQIRDAVREHAVEARRVKLSALAQ